MDLSQCAGEIGMRDCGVLVRYRVQPRSAQFAYPHSVKHGLGKGGRSNRRSADPRSTPFCTGSVLTTKSSLCLPQATVRAPA